MDKNTEFHLNGLQGKEATLYILEQYRSHCQTTVDMGNNADKENLKEVKKAIKWAKDQ